MRRRRLLGVVLAVVALAAFLALVRSADEGAEKVLGPQPGTERAPATRPLEIGTRGTVEVWAVGDGDGGEASAALARRIERARPELFLYLGDVYDDGTAGDFEREYAPTYGRIAARTSPTPGNHDWGEASEGYYPYWDRATGRRTPGLAVTRVGGWELVSLNSEAPHDRGSAQVRWLRDRVRAPGTCRLAFWHRPRYSAGTRHGDQADVAPLWDALIGHASIVLNGHEHNSQRFKPSGGLTELVAGAGGHGLYGLDARDGRVAFADARHYAALRLRLRPRSARFAFVSKDGRELDSGVVRCVRVR